jgi:hypothetical protein
LNAADDWGPKDAKLRAEWIEFGKTNNSKPNWVPKVLRRKRSPSNYEIGHRTSNDQSDSSNVKINESVSIEN